MNHAGGTPGGRGSREAGARAGANAHRDKRRFESTDALRVGVFLGGSLFVIVAFLFTSVMVTRLSEEVATTSRVLARFLAQASFPATRDPQLQEILAQVVAGIDFPIVITDIDSLPRAWRQIGIDTGSVPAASIDSLAQGRAVAPVIAQRIRQVRAHAAALDRRNQPIEMRQPVTGVRLGYVHYGVPPVLEALRWVPFLSVAGLLLLLAIGFWGLSGVRTAEGRSIWVGMARETAHQLGTPLSSLMGWIELLRSHAESQPGDTVSVPRAELDETLEEMERDVARLNKVAQRFSHVGSTPVLQLQDVTPIVRQAVQYARRRLPRGDGEVSIHERYEEVEPINLNAELLEWAVENLLSNAVSALDKRPARIEVTIQKRPETEAIELSIQDNGRGMAPAEQRRAFEPGYTTKRRGWGLGLALTRRVVEEYHGGRISIRASVPGEGTTMVITFPT
ncbi:MAG: HAMP domain-containing histidine kinase [Candidatus Eisenbacteria bacterium]|uniref:histidine kinase n=1 Tax=Eiseniibacteriota bacterium TaxID=2212470 RepID=A0A849SSD3_UNCEI|nr:HAMP domain-containing histidine kinase [Candidatus Eisenbacteria bacterium]